MTFLTEHPRRECNCSSLSGVCHCPPDSPRGHRIPDFSEPAPIREPLYLTPESWPDARKSGACRVDPNHNALGMLTQAQRGPVLRMLEEVCQGYEDRATAALRTMDAAAQAEQTFDRVERPGHYTSGAIECIDAIAAAMTPEQFRGFLRGNAIKYLWRFERKGGVEDLRKARWYLDRLTDSFDAQSTAA